MSLQVHHPKLLALLLLAIAAVTTVGLLFANDGDTVTPIPIVELPVLTEAEKEEAISIVNDSAIVKNISNGQDWKSELMVSAKYGGLEGASLDAVWSDPVSYSGPWALSSCQGYRKVFTYADYSNITRLEILVDLENDSVEAFIPMSGDTAEEQPVLVAGSHGDKEAKVYDMHTGELLFDGKKDGLDDYTLCPEGKEDEEGK